MLLILIKNTSLPQGQFRLICDKIVTNASRIDYIGLAIVEVFVNAFTFEALSMIYLIYYVAHSHYK